ncbi:MAG: mandelate racemase/muconate lactonizing enzyme family protein [Promethearchaeota archaeon]|jgi:L-alanine-DL-glutamate epimerase-like enolase superfamily enzyme
MKITDVTTILFEVPVEEGAYGTSRGFMSNLDHVIVQIHTDEGVTGIGLCAGPPRLVSSIIENVLKPLIVGEDPLFVERIWDKLYRATFSYGRAGALIVAISGIDVTLWDIVGKVAKMPVYMLLGGYRNKAPTYVMTGYYNRDLKIEQLLESRYTRWIEEGFKTIKMKVGLLNVDEDIRRVKTVRDTIGDEIELMVDANGAWNAHQAIRFAKKIERYNPYWFEEPVRADNLKGYAEVVRAIDFPVAGGENEYLRYGFRPLIEEKAIDIVQVDPLKSGGFTEFRKISALASAFNLPIGLHCEEEYEMSMHLAASDPNCLSVEVHPDIGRNPLYQVLWDDPPRIKDGYIELPKKPGLGIELSEEAIKKYSLK